MKQAIKFTIVFLAAVTFTSCASTGSGCYDFGNVEQVETLNTNTQNCDNSSKIVFMTKKC